MKSSSLILYCATLTIVGMIAEIDVQLRTEAWDFTHMMWSKMYENKKKKAGSTFCHSHSIIGHPL